MAEKGSKLRDFSFNCEVEQMSQDDAIIATSGEIDINTVPEFKQTIVDQIGLGTRHLVVDLTATEFIDSTALGVLVSAHKRLGESGTLSVVSNDENITRIFEITALDRIFNVYDIKENHNIGATNVAKKESLARKIADFILYR